jgi:hypothetical protein
MAREIQTGDKMGIEDLNMRTEESQRTFHATLFKISELQELSTAAHHKTETYLNLMLEIRKDGITKLIRLLGK